MSTIRRSAAAALLILVAASPAWAIGLSFGPPFGDHMVVQRDRPILV